VVLRLSSSRKDNFSGLSNGYILSPRTCDRAWLRHPKSNQTSFHVRVSYGEYNSPNRWNSAGIPEEAEWLRDRPKPSRAYLPGPRPDIASHGPKRYFQRPIFIGIKRNHFYLSPAPLSLSFLSLVYFTNIPRGRKYGSLFGNYEKTGREAQEVAA